MPAPGNGTLLIAVLLSLGLLFAGSWIVFYVTPGRDPRVLFRWFGLALATILAVALFAYLRRGRDRQGR